MKLPLPKILRGALALLLVGASPISAHAFGLHPGIPVTAAKLDKIKANLNVEPWKSAYASLLASSSSDLNRTPYGPWPVVTNKGQYGSDMFQLYNCALIWRLSGNTAYAEKALGILNAYANTVEYFQLNYLDFGDNIQGIMGADMLRGYAGFTPAMVTAAKNHFSMIWQYIDMNIGILRSANQGGNQLKSAFGIASFCDDVNRFAQCVDFYRNQPCVGLNVITPNGQIGDTGRDQGHGWGELAHYSWISETAWKQGVDLFSEKNNVLLQAVEYYSNYNTGGSPAFVQAGPCYDLYSTIGGGRSLTASAWAHHILYNHYVVRKGLSAPYSLQWMNTVNAFNREVIPWLHPSGAQAGGPPPAAVPAPVFTPPAVTSLTSATLGTVGVAGSATYSGGAWTVKGSGADMWGNTDNGQFAYAQLTGNGTLVARIASQQAFNGTSKAGIMMRDSLAANANCVAVWARAGVPNIQAFQRIAPTAGTVATAQDAPAVVDPPYWLKIRRNGTQFFVSTSRDGVNWTFLNNAGVGRNIAMGPTIYIGLVVCSADNAQLSTATFTNVGIDFNGGDFGNQTFKIVNRNSGKAMDVYAAGTADGSNVVQWDVGSGFNQLWSATALGAGKYRLVGLGSGKALDVNALSTADGANVQIWTYRPTAANQQFTMTPTTSGYQRVTPVHSGKAVEVAGSSTGNGGNVDQSTYTGGNHQQWMFQAP